MELLLWPQVLQSLKDARDAFQFLSLGAFDEVDIMLLQAKQRVKVGVATASQYLPNYFPVFDAGFQGRLADSFGQDEADWTLAVLCGGVGFCLSVAAIRLSAIAKECVSPAERVLAFAGPVGASPAPPAGGEAQQKASEDQGLLQSLRNASIFLGFSCALTVHNAWIFKSGFTHVFCLTCFHLFLCSLLGLTIYTFKCKWMTSLPSNPLEVLAGVALPAFLGAAGISSLGAAGFKNCPHPRQAFSMGLALGGVYLYNQLKAVAAPPPAKS